MPSKERTELIEEVKELILDGNLYGWTLQETSERILSTIRAAIQEPNEAMHSEGRTTVNYRDAWRAMLNASALGGQSE